MTPASFFCEAGDDEFARFFGISVNGFYRAMAMKRGRLIVGMAGIIEGDDGYHVGFLDLPIWERKRMLFRESVRFLKACADDGVTRITTTCDDRYPRAAEFLFRLGFEKTNNEVNGLPVWVWHAPNDKGTD